VNSENLDGLLSSVRRVFDKELDTARKVHHHPSFLIMQRCV
jgi:hypothetical protein